ncbi:RsmB/NOP family class I SAM-dependent RNA methyltransferase [Sinirhodobacter sp. WL0062]|uniref:RsmB/NOP family class I SAM-dependent RNA methyltransferase n=1 Tax=Rhodobacter flavimaris TaxID=2907145 RepID=A0ABS8YWN5_9RHOB|nr:RsmB/NOP family class I SAM-dependent RNA methyltransferase [Sinirhodobacter sp. WL0062]MCE5972140.1 RsmB/NOP family class I SAM-dependent RNA methyltransferase [Sinirhodobacter sp. WL0062]
MTPAARIQAAIEILDRALRGSPAEQVLTNWARTHRFAGSGDRAAIRDHVYVALRRRGTLAHLGGGLSGRGLMIGLARSEGIELDGIFTGERFAPAPLTPAEAQTVPAGEAWLDWPAWLRPALEESQGAKAAPIVVAMQSRAPVFLRVNLAKGDSASAISMLAEDGIVARSHPLAATALEVVEGERKIGNSSAYRSGVVELQDAASQAIASVLPIAPGMRVLDYCAGGGGKALALAARAPQAAIFAHDIDAGRMRDIPARAARAGARIGLRQPGKPGGPYDLVVVDAPCSGSGTWRRTPEAKWALTPDRLLELTQIQRDILATARKLVAPGGALAYMTCSLLADENERQVEWFLAQTGWTEEARLALTPLDGADGFFASVLRRAD